MPEQQGREWSAAPKRAPRNPNLYLQVAASSFTVFASQSLGTSLAAKLIVSALSTVVSSFLLAEPRDGRRRLVVVAILVALVQAVGRALAATASLAAVATPTPPGGRSSGWLPASWATVAIAAVVGFGIGSAATAVAGNWSTPTGHAASGKQADEGGKGHGPGQNGDDGGSDSGGEDHPEKVEVPEVLRLSRTKAAEVLEGDGLNPKFVEREGPTPAGFVVETDPVAGESVPPRSSVEVVISLGEPPRKCDEATEDCPPVECEGEECPPPVECEGEECEESPVEPE